MKKVIVLVALCLCMASAFGQMVLDQYFSGPTTAEIVQLSRSGKKIMALTNWGHTPYNDTVCFYNMDYSFWKMIKLPTTVSPCSFRGSMEGGGNVLFASETLFNLDTLLEIAFLADNGTAYIINENSVLADSITTGLSWDCSIYEEHGIFYLISLHGDGVRIFKLPGTLPCQNCCGRDTVVVRDTVVSMSYRGKPGIRTQPLPNPSKDEVKITFTLPDGVNRGELKLYSNSGQLIKSCQVDNHFGFIMLDNSLLPPGLYYYNIIANGQVSSTQKLLVVR